MVKLLRKWLGINKLDKELCELSDDIETTHNEYTDYYDTSETRYEDLKKEMAELKTQVEEFRLTLDLLKDNGITTRAELIDEWFNGKEVMAKE
jgi:predicted  nucleic acid-binding Zn-ribbon protein